MEKAKHRKIRVLSEHQTAPNKAAMHSPKCVSTTGLYPSDHRHAQQAHVYTNKNNLTMYNYLYN
jgi:hypothetical protein